MRGMTHAFTAFVCVAGGVLGCDARIRVDLAEVAPRPLGFREATFFPQHEHHVPSSVDDYEWAYFQQAGGLAIGDIDTDGLEDLFASGGAEGHQLFRNLGGGSFAAVHDGLPAITGFVSSATFADVDGDGDDDLLLSHLLAPRRMTLLRNEGGVFVDGTDEAGLGDVGGLPAWSTSFADIDGDGDIDFFVPGWLHWDTAEPIPSAHVFCNDGEGRFDDCSVWSGMAAHFARQVDSSFTATFADLDEDGAPDLLVAADYGRSEYFRGTGDGRFTSVPASAYLSIDLGMGAVVGDFNGDHHLDWFVTAAWFPGETYNSNGNRLMFGDGRGTLTDVTTTTGVGDGGWGWGACAADFDLDGDEDLFHVNGYEARPYSDLTSFGIADLSRLFLNERGVFSESAAMLGLDDAAHLTSAVCADFDGDGDVDIATQAVDGALRSYENTLFTARRFIAIDLVGSDRNRAAVGARVVVSAGDTSQVRERIIANTHTSGQSKRLHFGVGSADRADIVVRWPDGSRSEHRRLLTNRRHVLRQP